jgi:glutaminyl-peptide cyclotransferase
MALTSGYTINAFVIYVQGLSVLAAVLLFFIAGCRSSDKQPVSFRLIPCEFSATNAFIEIKALSAIAPRHSGSPGAQKAAEYILARLRAAGIDSSLDEFSQETPLGEVLFRNVTGVLPGRKPDGSPADEWIILGAHYDTKAGIADDFQGANDSGSGVGIVLELARDLKSCAGLPVNVLFAFFDGEECVSRYGRNDGLHGSRRLAEQFAGDGRSLKTRAVIILDMVADRDLNVTIPGNVALSLVSALFKAAEAEGTRAKFSLGTAHMLDDHAPFLAAGMPAIDVIDFEYGSKPGLNDYWHTPQDTIDKLSIQSIGIIGRTTLRMLDDLMRAM